MRKTNEEKNFLLSSSVKFWKEWSVISGFIEDIRMYTAKSI